MPDQAGLLEVAESTEGCGYEVVGDHPAADQAVVAVSEVVRGDGGSGTHQVVDGIVEDADRAAVEVSLQVAADLVVGVTEAVGLPVAAAVQQEPGRLDGPRRYDHILGAHRATPAGAAMVGNEADAGDTPGGVREDALGAGREQDAEVPRGGRPREH